MDKTWQNHRFPTTRWSLICEVKGEFEGAAVEALGEVSKIYWMPLYALARFKRWSPQDAEDAVQDFLVQLHGRGFFEKVNADRGRLRTYLRACFENHLRSGAKKRSSQKRGGGVEILSFDRAAAENALGPLEAPGMDLTSLYDRQWVLALLSHVLGKLEEGYAKRGKQVTFAALSPFLKFDADPETTEELAARLGKPKATVRQSLSRLRARYRDAVISEVRETVGNQNLAEEELAHLMGIFGG